MVCHYCATIDNFCLASLQWLKQTKQTEQTKNQKNKNPKKQKTTQEKQNDKTQLSATTSPFGCAILLFFCFLVFVVFRFLGLLFFWFLVFWFVVGCLKGWQNNTKKQTKQKNKKAKKTKKKQNDKTQLSLPLLPPWGVQSCFFWFPCFCGLLVSCFFVF